MGLLVGFNVWQVALFVMVSDCGLCFDLLVFACCFFCFSCHFIWVECLDCLFGIVLLCLVLRLMTLTYCVAVLLWFVVIDCLISWLVILIWVDT